MLRDGDDADSEQNINIGRTSQVVLPNSLNMQYYVMNEYLTKTKEKQIVRFAKTSMVTM